MFWTRKHQYESSNLEGFFKNFPCCGQFLQQFYKVQTNFVGFFHARCLNFPCFINYLAACMHAFCMFYLYVSLGISFMTFLLFAFLYCYSTVEAINCCCFFPPIFFHSPKETTQFANLIGFVIVDTCVWKPLRSKIS